MLWNCTVCLLNVCNCYRNGQGFGDINLKFDGLLSGRKTKAGVTLTSILLLSGCVSSVLETPQASVAAAPQATQTETLGLANAFPIPAYRPGTEPAPVPAETVATAPEVIEQPVVAVATVPTPAPIAETTETPTVAQTPKADVNDRIAVAEEAPVAGDAVVAAAPKAPVAPAPQLTAQAEPQERGGGFLNSLFGSNTNKATPRKAVALATPPKIIATASAAGSTAALPGVDRDRALGVNATNAIIEPIQVASAAGLARLTPNGIRTQHSGVDVKCLKPALVRVLKKVERRYGKPVTVTSGYRSPKRNASIRGANNSLHIYCSAADIQVAGVDKWALAKYLRSMPGRGGVGTYCHTKSVHVDIGPKRDWNWRCRRR